MGFCHREMPRSPNGALAPGTASNSTPFSPTNAQLNATIGSIASILEEGTTTPTHFTKSSAPMRTRKQLEKCNFCQVNAAPTTSATKCAICYQSAHITCIVKHKTTSDTINEIGLIESLKQAVIWVCDACKSQIYNFAEAKSALECDINRFQTRKQVNTNTNNTQSEADMNDEKSNRIAVLEAEVMGLRQQLAKRPRTETQLDAHLSLAETITSIVQPMIEKSMEMLHANIIASIRPSNQLSTPATTDSNHLTPRTRFKSRTFNANRESRSRTPKPQPNREPRSRTPKPQTKNQGQQPQKKSFAQIMKNVDSQRMSIRNIRITAENASEIMDAIHADDQIPSDVKIKKLSRKGDNFLSIQCLNAEEAEKLETAVTAKFAEKVTVAMPSTRPPQLKIVNLPNDITEEDLVINIKRYNYWLAEANITYNRHYKIDTGKRRYTVAIVDIDLISFKQCLFNGSILYRFTDCKVYEYVHLSQCSKCLRFGHFASSCTFSIRCRNCGKTHPLSECTSDSLACANCIRANKNSSNKCRVDHKATSDLCPSREKRVAGLQSFFSNKGSSKN